MAYVHPADRFTTETLLDTALRDGTPYIATYRWTRPDTNEVRVIHCRAHTDPITRSFEGVMMDITAEAPKLRGEGDIALAVGSLLHHMGLPGITLDLELTIRCVLPGAGSHQLSLGTAEINQSLLKPGANLLDCFTSAPSRNYAHALLEKALTLRGENVEVAGSGSRTVMRALLSENIAQGLIIFSLDTRSELEAQKQVHSLQQELNHLEAMRACRPAIASATQEIAGYGALITRHARGNQLLAAISDSLQQSIRELAQTADSLGPPEPTIHSRPKGPMSRKRSHPHPTRTTANPDPLVIFASNSKRCATSHALLLRESGMACCSSTVDEASLYPLLKPGGQPQVIVIDAPHPLLGVTALIRRIRRKHPQVQIACLVAADTTDHEDLLRAGATTLMMKPAPAEEIERIVKALSSLTSTATRPPIS